MFWNYHCDHLNSQVLFLSLKKYFIFLQFDDTQIMHVIVKSVFIVHFQLSVTREVADILVQSVQML
jgi:hypothetical protein